MIEVNVKSPDHLESALKQLKSKIISSGILETVFLKRTFENSQKKKKRKQKALHKKLKEKR